MNRIDQLLQLLNTLTDDEKMRCTGLLWELLIRPRYKESVTGNETLDELRIDPVDYSLFKKKCLQISRDVIPDFLLTDFLVSHILQETFSAGDTTSIERYKSRMQRIIDSFEDGDETPERIEDAKKRVQGFIDTAEGSFAESYRTYTAFCEKVVANLLLMPGGSID